jgi:hypothetical protein
MQIRLVYSNVGHEIYGLVDTLNVSHYEGSKIEVLSLYIGLVGKMAYA